MDIDNIVILDNTERICPVFKASNLNLLKQNNI